MGILQHLLEARIKGYDSKVIIMAGYGVNIEVGDMIQKLIKAIDKIMNNNGTRDFFYRNELQC